MANTGYIGSLPGLLKIVEAVLCLAGFICAMIPYDIFTPGGGGWTQFVCITAIFGVVAILICNVALVNQLPAVFPLLVLIFYIVYDLFLLSAGILTAVRASQWYQVFSGVGGRFSSGFVVIGHVYPYQAIAACAFFVLVAFIVFVVDTILSVSAWRSASTMSNGTSNTTTTTTTATSKSTVVVS